MKPSAMAHTLKLESKDSAHDVVNFEEFKSTLERKMESFQREATGTTQLKIAATSSDLPPERRQTYLNKI